MVRNTMKKIYPLDKISNLTDLHTYKTVANIEIHVLCNALL